MFERLENILSQLQAFVEGFDASGLDRAQSLELYDRLCRGERLMHAAKALAGKQLMECRAWHDTGHRSPAHFMAAVAGTTISHQCHMLEVADLLPRLPETDRAFRSGALTEEKVIDLAFAAALDPESEEGLLVLAEAASLEEFRDECARVRHAASSEAQRHERAHRRRYLRHWIDLDGAFRLSASFTPEAGAQIISALEPYRHKVSDRLSKRGRKGRAPSGAVLADALVEMAEHDRTAGNDGSGPRAMIRSPDGLRGDDAGLHRARRDLRGARGRADLGCRGQLDARKRPGYRSGDGRHRHPQRDQDGKGDPGQDAGGPDRAGPVLRGPRVRAEARPGDRPHRPGPPGRADHPVQPGPDVRVAPLPKDPPGVRPGTKTRSLVVGRAVCRTNNP